MFQHHKYNYQTSLDLLPQDQTCELGTFVQEILV